MDVIIRDINYILMRFNKIFKKLFNKVIFKLFLKFITVLKYNERKEMINV